MDKHDQTKVEIEFNEFHLSGLVIALKNTEDLYPDSIDDYLHKSLLQKIEIAYQELDFRRQSKEYKKYLGLKKKYESK